MCRLRAFPAVCLAVWLGIPLLGGLAVARAAELADPLGNELAQATAFLRRQESGGVTLDPRHLGSFPEQIRLTVVTQLSGFCELYRVSPTTSARDDIQQRADYLVRYGAWIRSYDAADGLLANALLQAYEALGNPAYRDAAWPIVAWCLADPGGATTNRQLMAALALARYHRLTGDPVALAKVQDAVLLAARSQHADGSFGHVCDASRDVHYTAWISMELDRIGELVNDPNVARILSRTFAFLQGRVGLDGEVRYVDTLSTGATIYYYSLPACPSDYDTRGWTNELGYHALLFDRYQDTRYHGVMGRLRNLENQGAWPDKWAYLPAPADPAYVASSSAASVIRTSSIFWAMACVNARRIGRAKVAYTTSPAANGALAPGGSLTGGAAPSESPEARPTLGPIRPNPARDGAWISMRLGRSGDARLSIHDAAGRRVRTLLVGPAAAGESRVRWDGRDDRGARVAPGVFFVRLETAEGTRAAPLALIR